MKNYNDLMARKNEIMKTAVGIDYDTFELEGCAFDFERMMRETGYTIEELREIQEYFFVGHTPIIEMYNLTELARKYAKPGYGARIMIKDEATNPSGSFKARRASIAVHQAKKLGYKGIMAATSGNYGAGVASLAAKVGLDCIVVQETYDSRHVGQPEIVEKARACEAYGAEVMQLTVGPELFYVFLDILEDTGYFNASLYTPFGIAGVETLGYEISMDMREKYGKDPEVVVVTNAGGGNLTGTARGLIKAGATDTKIVAASVDLSGLHMASDTDFNRKSFTTGHTGFGIPFCTNPDRSDVPRSAARPMRYIDEYYTIGQGSVFYMTELLANLEGLERGPAGNTSLAVAFKLAQEMKEDEIILVQETEYTGAGKHINPQLSFARDHGIEIYFGDTEDEVPGKNIILPEDPGKIDVVELDLMGIKRSYMRNILRTKEGEFSDVEIKYLCEEIKLNEEELHKLISELRE
ncbi:MAG TPA: 2-amino-4-oxopentanoate thiolase subunit OrtB [Clostridia bacterium]|nr:2-amino-4-oxopentanoate thiolase subunit OrtB [Clostridia bacterium]